MAHPPDRKELITEIDAARDILAGYTAALRQDFDIGARLKRAVRGNPAVWFGGAAVVGLLLSRIGTVRRNVVVKGADKRTEQVETAGKAAFALTALKFGFDLARPALLRWMKARYANR